ncbi:retrovirus-like pol polyprotein, partial [Lasius niger]
MTARIRPSNVVDMDVNEAVDVAAAEAINATEDIIDGDTILEIGGKRAVDCLLHGIDDRSVRLGAKAADCKEPKHVLKYMQSIKQRPRESDKSKGYIDLGSQCTLLRHNKAVGMGIAWSVNNLPVMRGIGNSMIMPVGSATVTIEIGEIVESVEIYIVDDNVIKYDMLVGHSFTEEPGIVIIKTASSLAFKRDFSSKSSLRVRDDIAMQPGELTVIPIYADPGHSKHVY